MSANFPVHRFSRRQFLRTASVAAGGLLITACAAPQPAPTAAPAAPAATQPPAPTAVPPPAKEIIITALFNPGGITDAVHEQIAAFKKIRPDITFKETLIDAEQNAPRKSAF